MRQALREAHKGIGKTSPNPPVGAVVVKHDHVIARGYHKKAGGPHAEVVALSKAGQHAKSSDLYVTLEPCSTFGKTPPCTEAIIQSGIKRVFVGSVDPTEANGHVGLDLLRKANIEVIESCLAEECDQLIAPFKTFVNQQRPWIIAKVAMSLDGRIACSNGDSQWITSLESRQLVHKLRRQVDAILVGRKTRAR